MSGTRDMHGINAHRDSYAYHGNGNRVTEN
jgi:hypothetical protein